MRGLEDLSDLESIELGHFVIENDGVERDPRHLARTDPPAGALLRSARSDAQAGAGHGAARRRLCRRAHRLGGTARWGWRSFATPSASRRRCSGGVGPHRGSVAAVGGVDVAEVEPDVSVVGVTLQRFDIMFSEGSNGTRAEF